MRFFPEIKEIKRELIQGENIEIMKTLIESGYEGKFKMIYFDGPFNSGIIYSDSNADHGCEFIQPWSQYDSIHNYIQPGRYLDAYRKRIELARQLLSDDGILVLQTNQLFGHHIKVILEDVFGWGNMLPEVIWKHSEHPWAVINGSPIGYHHESLFFYIKSEAYLQNRGGQPVAPAIWDDIPGYDEEDNYPTQKPVRLIERILELTTQEGDLVGDFYCGSGTFPFVAEKKGRKWLSCDNNPHAIELTTNRLKGIIQSFQVQHASDDFNSSLLNGQAYTKVTKTPVSFHELQPVLDNSVSLLEVNAYSFSYDVDLANQNQYLKFNYVFPLISKDGFSETETIKMPRPTPLMDSNGYWLLVENPLEWILYHLIFVDRNEINLLNLSRYDKGYKHIFQWEKTLERAMELRLRINGNWIAEVIESAREAVITDVFGYKYSVQHNQRGNG